MNLPPTVGGYAPSEVGIGCSSLFVVTVLYDQTNLFCLAQLTPSLFLSLTALPCAFEGKFQNA